MKKLRFALLDQTGYMDLLSTYISKKQLRVESRYFTSPDKLQKYLEENDVDVLLTGQEFSLLPFQQSSRIGKVIVLSDGDLVRESSDVPVIFKYQSAEVILGEVFSLLAEDSGIPALQPERRDRKIEFVGMYSSYGIPNDMHRELSDAANGSRLFLNMELFDGQGSEEGRKEEHEIVPMRGMSELIFYLKQRREKLAIKLLSLVRDCDGMDCIYPVEDYRDLYSLLPEDIDRLLTFFSEETSYEAVYFDVGFVSEASLYLLYRCDRIMLPKAANQWEANKQSSWESLLIREGMEGALKNIEYIGRSGGGAFDCRA